MRTDPLTLEEATHIVERSRAFLSALTISSLEQHLDLAEVPRQIARRAISDLDIKGDPTTDDNIARELIRLHKAFLKTASLEDRERCFLRKAIAYFGSLDSNKRWEDHFASEIEKEFSVPGEIGEVAMQNTPVVLGESWTDQVVENVLTKINEIKNGASATAP